MNALPNAATTASGPRPLAIPVARPATVTTRRGFIRRTNPITTIATPMRVSILAGHGVVSTRSERGCEQITRALKSVIQVREKVLGPDLLEHRRTGQRDEWLHMYIRKQYRSPVLSTPMYHVLERVHACGVEKQHVTHSDYQHLGLTGDLAQCVFEGFRRAEEKGAVDLVDLDARRDGPQTDAVLIRCVTIRIVVLEFLLERAHVRYLSHPLHEQESSEHHSDADCNREID